HGCSEIPLKRKEGVFRDFLSKFFRADSANRNGGILGLKKSVGKAGSLTKLGDAGNRSTVVQNQRPHHDVHIAGETIGVYRAPQGPRPRYPKGQTLPLLGLVQHRREPRRKASAHPTKEATGRNPTCSQAKIWQTVGQPTHELAMVRSRISPASQA